MIDPLRQYLLDRLVLRPSRQPIDPGSQQRVMLPLAGGELECFVQRGIATTAPTSLLVLKFPGTAGRAERSTAFPLDLIPETSGEIWTWNPPGYGRSSGRASFTRMAETATAFWDQVIARRGDRSSPVLLCGNSLGCLAALRVAETVQNGSHRIGLMLRNPPPLAPVVKRVARKYPLGRLVDSIAESLPSQLDVLAVAAKVRAPAVFLQSELDTLVPPSLQQQVIDAYAGPKRTVVMKGLSHGGLSDESHLPLIQDAVRWLVADVDSADPA